MSTTRWAASLCIPLLPYVDHPVEAAIDFGFDKAWPVDENKDRPSH
eukprot:CAMPEP_0119364436 /NCGR_PEP_ID=MMETSP1334-20130426/11353_1 /TAXON_ID=127549 /ORGANISM="Calcidiscus leptoporus, Strain RCC1130" /LENGTH=45 /DNA_ID= /DNA_START= /DNA_END= /DNA_ORIENTATION=